MLHSRGFWVHNMAQNAAGQPFDVIAVRNGRAYPFDCKVCGSDRFPLSRIEENQASAMKRWREAGNGEGWFALEMSSGAIYLLPFSFLEMLTVKSLGLAWIERFGLTPERWESECESLSET